ncbi:MAG: hypothetical protein A2275_04935 [Bacteroidetes bacterium RIFOXYA12_FULL_35_11]|nr:MAG: hypothetical protein A2X01_10490 [Bacteroidetes bacterium GWF2_35_48]OFY78239.1 MAG: hypothetical protein A2275_04935 [Bacteroidetes bacterium RIFOXYA12_FULL_35_11]OFY94917.1 MAG: hypothetical protein A2309_02280 [Bacteroidetes bacterium RIFOXYB2_FULL_35_7]HBX49923.1 hypothetical protein [Bacteroidales bacterium]
MKSKIYFLATIFIITAFLYLLFSGCEKEEPEPIFETGVVFNITQTSAYCSTKMDDREIDGTFEISEKGVCWSTNNSPTINDGRTIDGSGMGNYNSYISSLKPNTLYSLRSYVVYKGEVLYRELTQFYTLSFDTIKFNTQLTYGIMSDPEGNNYKTIQIGSQKWMAENLKVKKYKDGSDIPNLYGNYDWNKTESGAYCDYKNISDYSEKFGRIYNWAAVSSGKLCPAGWHVPSDAEWKTLEIAVGMSPGAADYESWRGNNEGLAMKENGDKHWQHPYNMDPANVSGFTALPDGQRLADGTYFYDGYISGYWTSTASNDEKAWYRGFSSSKNTINRSEVDKKNGHWVRCVQD